MNNNQKSFEEGSKHLSEITYYTQKYEPNNFYKTKTISGHEVRFHFQEVIGECVIEFLSVYKNGKGEIPVQYSSDVSNLFGALLTTRYTDILEEAIPQFIDSVHSVIRTYGDDRIMDEEYNDMITLDEDNFCKAIKENNEEILKEQKKIKYRIKKFFRDRRIN